MIPFFWREGWGLVSIINVDIMHCHQDVVDMQIIDLLVHQSPFPLTLFAIPCNCQQQPYLTSGQWIWSPLKCVIRQTTNIQMIREKKISNRRIRVHSAGTGGKGVHRFQSLMVQRSHGVMVQRSHGLMAHWSHGLIVHWSLGSSVCLPLTLFSVPMLFSITSLSHFRSLNLISTEVRHLLLLSSLLFSSLLSLVSLPIILSLRLCIKAHNISKLIIIQVLVFD